MQWRAVAGEAIELLARPDSVLPTRCFGVMNCAYLCFATGDTEFLTVARQHVAAELATLTDPELLSVSGARDISLLLRALVYGVRLIDDRAAGFLSTAARLAIQRIDLEFLADDDV